MSNRTLAGTKRTHADWAVKRLESFLSFLTSGSRGWAAHYADSGDLFLRIQNVGANRLILNDVAFVRAPNTAEARRTIVQPGDVLLSITADLGRTAVIPEGVGRAFINQHLAILRVEGINPHYLSAFLASPSGQAQFLRLNREGVKAGLNFDDIRSVEIPLPPLDEQRRIVAILDAADSLRAKRRAALAKLEQLAQSIFIEMFGEIEKSEGGVETVDFADVVYFQEGPGVRNWQFRSEGIKLINVKNIVNGRLEISNTDRHLESCEVEKRYSHFLLNPGDYVLASSGVTWGKVAEVLEKDLPLCLNTSMIRVRPKDDRLTKRFLRAFIELGSFKKQVLRLITGSAQPNFGPSHLRQLYIPLPSKAEQIDFQRKMDAIDQAKIQNRRFSAESDRLFASLQHRAFRGEL
jgi:restriction endonuclease S subunit